MSIFEIIGPVMIGPSSSHTAGAARLGYISAELFGEQPETVSVILSGSFAKTGKGHGTKEAIAGGLLGYKPDDERIKNSLAAAQINSMNIIFSERDIEGAHPNTAVIKMKKGMREMTVEGSSVGGGEIVISAINGQRVYFTAEYNTLIIFSEDRKGMAAGVAGILAEADINIANMRLSRSGRGKDVITVIETDQAVDETAVDRIRHTGNVKGVVYLQK